MATKNYCFFDKVVKGKPLNDQYSNLNLNQTHESLHSDDNVHSKSIKNNSRKVKDYDFMDSKNDFQAKRSSSSWKKSNKQLSPNFLNLNRASEEEDELDKSKSANNKSTLSLHIVAYENSIEATAADSDDIEKEGSKIKNDKTNLIQKFSKQNVFDSLLFIKNPFDFPRQHQEEDRKNHPEVMQFKASQQLLLSNEGHEKGTVAAPSLALQRTRPSSKQLSRRLTEFSLSAVVAPNGKIGNQSLQLQWTETIPSKQFPFQFLSGGGGDRDNIYDDLQLTDHPSAALYQQSISSTLGSTSSAWSKSTNYAPPTSDIFATSVTASSPQSTKSKMCCNRRCPSSAPASFSDQMVLYVSVDLRITFFQYPGLIVRKQIVKEVRNDLTVLEVLQHLIKCAGIDLTPSMNGETARLFCQRTPQRNGKGRLEEIDYLQWRCALLAEMNSVQIQFVLDFTDTEEGTSSSRASTSSSAHSICPIDMEFKQ